MRVVVERYGEEIDVPALLLRTAAFSGPGPSGSFRSRDFTTPAQLLRVMPPPPNPRQQHHFAPHCNLVWVVLTHVPQEARPHTTAPSKTHTQSKGAWQRGARAAQMQCNAQYGQTDWGGGGSGLSFPWVCVSGVHCPMSVKVVPPAIHVHNAHTHWHIRRPFAGVAISKIQAQSHGREGISAAGQDASYGPGGARGKTCQQLRQL